MHFGRFHLCGSVWRQIFDMSIAVRCGRRSKPIQPAGRPFSQDSTPLPPANRFERRAIRAAGAGHEEVVRLLVERGARLDLKGVLWRATPAHWAKHAGKTEIEEYLRRKVEVRSGNKTAFSHTSIVRFMLPAQPLDALS
jgi:hypothetical protein